MRERWIAIPMLWLSLFGCSTEKHVGHAPDAKLVRPVAVNVETIKRQSVGQSLDFVGELKAQKSVELSSKLPGRIRTIHVRMGDAVNKGDVLVEIEDSHLRAQLAEVKASYEVAQASIQRALVQEKNASAELTRKQKLVAKDLVTQQEMDNVRSRQATEAASLDLARAQAAQAQARIQLLQDQLSDARIRSPLKGRVEARYLDPGAVVGTQTAILRLIDLDPIIARFQVPERFLGQIMKRTSDSESPIAVQVRLDAYPAEVFTGRIARVSPALDKTTRAAFIEAEIPNQQGRLVPGMYCRLSLDLGIKKDVLLVPLQAIVDSGLSPTHLQNNPGNKEKAQGQVFTVVQGRAQQSRLSLGKRFGEYRHVLDGLQQGDQVVVEGQSLLKDGSTLKILKIDGQVVAKGES